VSLAYQRHEIQRTLAEPPAVWREGSTRLLDYGATHRAARKRGTRAVLVVPSLINRWEVLDLTEEKSLLRAMAAAGLRPYLVDWGTPGDEERRFDTTAYVARLERGARLRGKASAAGAGSPGLLHGRYARRGPWRRAGRVGSRGWR
jgi:polyhydroxyalkanoate synthase